MGFRAQGLGFRVPGKGFFKVLSRASTRLYRLQGLDPTCVKILYGSEKDLSPDLSVQVGSFKGVVWVLQGFMGCIGLAGAF